ncbi:MAG: ABC transporter permease [Bacteroidota bacterium]|nr:ABC transporter permease [Bacteroidota bacterium]
MAAYLIRRIINGLLVLLGVVRLVFLIFELKPGDPARMLTDQRSSPEALAAIRKDLGLGLPLSTRYFLYLNDLSPIAIMQDQDPERPAFLDRDRYTVASTIPIGKKLIVLKAPYLRFSYQSRRGVTEILANAFPNTAILAVTSMLLAVILGLIMGTWAAVKKGTWIDGALLGVSALGMAGPSFFVAVLAAWLGGYVWYEQITLPLWPILFLLFLAGGKLIRMWKPEFDPRMRSFLGLHWYFSSWQIAVVFIIWCVALLIGQEWATSTIQLPGTGLPMSGDLVDVDPFTGPFINWRHMILPTLVLGIRPLAIVVQLTRSSLLDVLSQDHIRTARAKGLSEFDVVVKHGLRNALMPVLTAVSGWFASLLAGAVFVEFVFGWKGMGLEVFNALQREDMPVVMGAVLVFASIFVVMNVVVDLLYAVLDPRVRTA